MKKLLPFLAFSLLLFSHCKITKYTPDKLPSKYMIIGDGGGFAGIETSYTLLENGQVFRKVGSGGNYEELKAIKVKDAKALFEKLSSLQLYKLDIEKPGNLYYFVRDVNTNTDSRVTWGAGDYLPPQSIISFYKEVSSTLKKRQPIKTLAVKETEEEKKKKEEEEKTKW
jgi:hypothetical protein